MYVHLPPDLETMVKKRLSSGGYHSIEAAGFSHPLAWMLRSR
jgi:hypothetical protein